MKRGKVEDLTAKSFFEKAEDLHKRNLVEECRLQLKLGLGKNTSEIPYVEIFDEKVASTKSISFVLPKKGCLSKKMILDGMSYYSCVIWAALEFLVSNGRKHIVLSLNNVAYLSDLGPSLLVHLHEQAKQHGAAIKYINASAEIREMVELYSTEENNLPDLFYCACDAVTSFE